MIGDINRDDKVDYKDAYIYHEIINGDDGEYSGDGCSGCLLFFIIIMIILIIF